MKSSIKTSAGVLLAVMLFSAVLVIAPAAQARSIMPVKGAKFDTVSSIKDNLKAHTGKDVVIYVR